MANIVYVGTSLDGYIAGANGELDWLGHVPIPECNDLGFAAFMERIDAVVMGRRTFETLIGFGVGWHYPRPGIVLSSTLQSLPPEFADRVQLARGSPPEVVATAKRAGYENLYIDGGNTAQRFLEHDLVDELIITEIPLLLGGGIRLFGRHERRLAFELVGTQVLLGQLLRKHYRRVRER
jgi:dihydrofolate reductase